LLQIIIKTRNGVLKQKEKGKKNYASSKKLLTSIKEKGPLGKKSPFTRVLLVIPLVLTNSFCSL